MSRLWEWRKNYRVWEANRKLFVYPENWIEPDRRLPVTCQAALRRVVVAVRRRGAAPVLFTGRNRAGLLVAGRTLAADLGLDLYRVDLSHVVGKYIGETGKNLQRVFDAAEKAGVVLLLDEADALFGRRTDVKDSHDRYANREVNYLLQRIEDFEGLAILATNTRRDLNAAFLRRFRFIIRVPSR